MTRTVTTDSVVKRDWGDLNEQYVRRGEVAFDLAFLASWRSELDEMNENKKGRPYRYPRSLVRFVRLLRDVWHLALRQAEGLLRALSDELGFAVPDYTTLWYRLVADEAEESVTSGDDVTLAVDSTGIAVTRRGEWLRDKWHVHRGFIKAHVAVDVETLEIVAVMVGDDHSYDAHYLVPLVQRSLDQGTQVVRVLADAAYDTRYNFDFLHRNGIDAGINLRKNADQRLKGGTFARPMAARELRRLGKEGWKLKHGYGMRWKVECAFSAVKRVMSEALRSTRRDLMLREAQHKFWTYNMLARA